MPDLAKLQMQFGTGLDAGAMEADALQPYIGEPRRAERGLGIYRGNIRANTAKALGATYPVIEKIVGAEFFSGLTAAYRRRFPSTNGDLHAYGEYFAGFLDEFAPAVELPYLPDVARLEWHVHRAHYAADPEPFNPASLAGLSSEQQAGLRPQLHPACRVQQSAYPLARIWEVHQASFAGEFKVEFPEHATNALIYRPRYRVEVASITDAQAAFLVAALDGQPLAVALAAAQARDAVFDLGQALGEWMESSVITNFELKGE